MPITKSESFKASDNTLHRTLKEAVDHEIAQVIDMAIEDWGAQKITEITSKTLASILTQQPFRSQITSLFNELG